MREKTKGRIVSAFVPGMLLLGTRLGDWYDKNPHHRFGNGDILILRRRNIVGYGIRPVAVTKGYSVIEGISGREGKYDITMHVDEGEDFLRWIEHNEVPHGVERTVNDELHHKWNIEHQFRRVSVDSVDEALALYASREATIQERVA